MDWDQFKTLQLEEPHSFILLVTLNRPEVRNAINFLMMQELLTLWQRLKTSNGIRCVILTGKENTFCAGADLKERKDMSLDVWRQQRSVLEEAMRTMLLCPMPIIAAVEGAAFGGGLELMLTCDFAYAAESARFSQSEVKLGLIPGALGTQNLPRACGIRRAKELTFTGNIFTAQEAYTWGIVNQLFPDNTVKAAALKTAILISENAPLAIKQAKFALNASQQGSIQAGFDIEIEAYNRLLNTQDRLEGIRAFNEKRKPQFSGK